MLSDPLVLAAAVFLSVLMVCIFAARLLVLRPDREVARVLGENTEVRAESTAVTLGRACLQRFTAAIPVRSSSADRIQKMLVQAGFRAASASGLFAAIRYTATVVLTLLSVLMSAFFDLVSGTSLMIVAGAVAAGMIGPSVYLKRRVKRRQHKLRRSLPNTLDLLTVCVEAGLGLDQAMLQAAAELRVAYPAIAEELSLTNLEIKAGKSRNEALRALGDRTGVEDLTRLSSVLIQADRFGTSIAQTLRGQSDFLRVKTRQAAEEKAAKLGVKLVFPIFFFIMPTLFIITVGPVVVTILTELIPMMENM